MGGRLVEDCNGILERAFLHDLLCDCIPKSNAEKQALCFGLNTAAAQKLQVLLIRRDAAGMRNESLCDASCAFGSAFRETLADAFKRFAFFRLLAISFDTYALIADISENSAVLVLENIFSEREFTAARGFRCAAGIPVFSVLHIGVSYRDAAQLLELSSCRPSCGEGRYTVFTRENIRSAVPARIVRYSLASEQMLMHAVIHKKIERWQSVLTDIIIENKTLQNTALLAVLFTSTLYRILDVVQADADDIYEKNGALFFNIAACKSHDELYEHMKAVFMAVTEGIRFAHNKKNSFYCARMQEFIQANYTKDIGLCDMAEALELSPNYASAVFKSMFGKNFKDYLDNYRYEAACRLIHAAPSKKLKQVALDCGCNSNTLTRIFMKYGGMLPSDFQKAALQT